MTDASLYVQKKGTLKEYFNRNQKELEETLLEYNSCDNKCTNKDSLRMHKGVTHKFNLSNCYKSDYSCTKNELQLMHKFRKQ